MIIPLTEREILPPWEVIKGKDWPFLFVCIVGTPLWNAAVVVVRFKIFSDIRSRYLACQHVMWVAVKEEKQSKGKAIELFVIPVLHQNVSWHWNGMHRRLCCDDDNINPVHIDCRSCPIVCCCSAPTTTRPWIMTVRSFASRRRRRRLERCFPSALAAYLPIVSVLVVIKVSGTDWLKEEFRSKGIWSFVKELNRFLFGCH